MPREQEQEAPRVAAMVREREQIAFRPKRNREQEQEVPREQEQEAPKVAAMDREREQIALSPKR